MRITFCLRNPNAGENETPINCFVHFHQNQVLFATGLKISPKLWDKKRKRAKKGATQEAVVNTGLAAMEQVIQKLFAEMGALGIEQTPAAVRERFAVMNGKRAAKKIPPFFDAYETFIKSLEGRLQSGTIKVHKTARTHLREFSKTYDVTIDYHSFNVLLFDKLLRYLTSVVKVNNVTAWKAISTIRVFLKHCADEGYTTNRDYEKFTRKRLPRGEKSEKVYCTLAELELLKAVDLGGNRKLEVTRDLYIFQCSTGLRWGDVQRIGIEHVHGNELRLVTGKNKKAIRVPLLPLAKQILEKYEYRLPRRTNQRQNQYIKELCEKAKIDRSISIVDYRGTERIEDVMPKYKLIGTHTAKRTFVSLLRKHGVTIEAICRLTGNSRTSIESYLLKDERDMEEEIEIMQKAFA